MQHDISMKKAETQRVGKLLDQQAERVIIGGLEVATDIHEYDTDMLIKWVCPNNDCQAEQEDNCNQEPYCSFCHYQYTWSEVIQLNEGGSMQVQIRQLHETNQLYAVVVDEFDDVFQAEKIERHELSRCLNGNINTRPELVEYFNRMRPTFSVIDARNYRGGKR